MPGRDFLALMVATGFDRARLVRMTGCKTSPYTEGALFVAEKPGVVLRTGESMKTPDPLTLFQEFSWATLAPGALDKKTKLLIALGASLAGACEL